jgi:hypothetical protein
MHRENIFLPAVMIKRLNSGMLKIEALSGHSEFLSVTVNSADYMAVHCHPMESWQLLEELQSIYAFTFSALLI